jgi:hypothetical protein
MMDPPPLVEKMLTHACSFDDAVIVQNKGQDKGKGQADADKGKKPKGAHRGDKGKGRTWSRSRSASRTRRAEKYVAEQNNLADKFLVNFLLHGTHIRVKLPTGRTFMLAVQVTDTIANIKAKIENKEGIPTNQQKLVEELDDCSCLCGRNPLMNLLMLPVYLDRET